jgi:hypothetical protein
MIFSIATPEQPQIRPRSSARFLFKSPPWSPEEEVETSPATTLELLGKTLFME